MNTITKLFSAIIILYLVAWFSQSAIAQSGDAPFTYNDNATGSLNAARARRTEATSVSTLSNGDAPFTFNATGGLNIPRAYHPAILLPDGKVLVAGGYDENNHALGSGRTVRPGERELGGHGQPQHRPL